MSEVAQATKPARGNAEARRGQIVQAAVKLFARKGYHATTIEEIAAEAGVSKGLVYVYFEDKTDVLFLTLCFVLEIYAREIPALLHGTRHPLCRLETAFRAYLSLIDQYRDATLLAYRSTADLPAGKRQKIKAAESRVNRILQSCIEPCIHEGLLAPANLDFLVYQYVLFCHSWALKHWAFRDKYDLDEYAAEGLRLLIDPHLTEKGRAERSAPR